MLQTGWQPQKSFRLNEFVVHAVYVFVVSAGDNRSFMTKKEFVKGSRVWHKRDEVSVDPTIKDGYSSIAESIISEMPFAFVWKRVNVRRHWYEYGLCLLVRFHANQTHFHMKAFARGLVLKQRRKVTKKWPQYLYRNHPETIIKYFVTNLNKHKHSIRSGQEMLLSGSCITYKFLNSLLAP